MTYFSNYASLADIRTVDTLARQYVCVWQRNQMTRSMSGGRHHATYSLNGAKWSIIVNQQAVWMLRQNVCLILEISWNVRNDTPISTFCPPLSTHCLFVQGDTAVKELVLTDKNKQYHKPLNPLRCVYCPTVPQTVCLLDKRFPFMVCKINTGLQCKCSSMYQHLLSLHQQVRYNVHSWVPF